MGELAYQLASQSTDFRQVIVVRTYLTKFGKQLRDLSRKGNSHQWNRSDPFRGDWSYRNRRARLARPGCPMAYALRSGWRNPQTISFGDVLVQACSPPPAFSLWRSPLRYLSHAKTLHLPPATNSWPSTAGCVLPSIRPLDRYPTHVCCVWNVVGPSCRLCQGLRGIPNEIYLISHGLLRFISVYRKFVCNGCCGAG